MTLFLICNIFKAEINIFLTIKARFYSLIPFLRTTKIVSGENMVCEKNSKQIIIIIIITIIFDSK